MRKLLTIGFWKSEKEPENPDILSFVDYSWDDDIRNKVVEYLEKVEPFVVAGGPTPCILRCEQKYTSFGSCCDGHFCWPLNLAHYVAYHGIRLPDLFVEHIINNFDTVESIFEFNFKDDIDCSWWKSQKGFTDSQAILPGEIGEIWIEPVETRLTPKIIHFLQSFVDFEHRSIKHLYDLLQSKNAFLLKENCFYADFFSVYIRARRVGINVVFIPRKE